MKNVMHTFKNFNFSTEKKEMKSFLTKEKTIILLGN